MRRVAALAAALAALLTVAAAEAKLARGGPASVTFTAAGPGGMKIVGTTTDLDVADDGQNVTISVPLANLTTGISLRDQHMKEKYLQVQSFPTATLRVARSAVQVAPGATAEADIPGTMTIHGHDHPVTVHFKARSSGANVDVDGATHVNMKDYAIEVPSYLGVTVKPDVDLAVHFVAHDG
jgi:polyisoprenoid-binding protein YceI